MERSDPQLLKDWCVRRDAHAFQAIVQRHAAMVFHTALRILNNRADAEDTTQTCFETLVATEEVGHIRVLGAWLHGMATKLSLKHIRTTSRRSQREQDFVEAADQTDETRAWQEIYPIIDEAIQSLDERFRTPVVAHFLAGQSHAAIAKEMEMSRSTISNRINQGIQQVEAILKKKGVLPASVLAPFLTNQLADAAPVNASLVSRLGTLALAQGQGVTPPAHGALTPSTKRRWVRWETAAILVVAVVIIATFGPRMTRSGDVSPQSTDAATTNVARVQQASVDPTETSVESVQLASESEVDALPPGAETKGEADDPEVSGNYPGVVHGVVVYDGGAVAAGISVRLREDFRFGVRASEAYPPVAQDQITDATGQFRFENIPVGQRTRFFDTSLSYVLLAEDEGWSGMLHASPYQKDTHEYVKIILKASPMRVGRVIDESGEAVSGARVFAAGRSALAPDGLLEQHSFSVVTDGGGEYRLAIPADAPNRIRVEADGYATRSHALDLGRFLPGELSLSRGHSLSGILMDRQSQTPLAGVRVRLWDTDYQRRSRTIESDEQGRVTFDSLENNTYRITLEDDEWTTADGEQRFIIDNADLLDQELFAGIGGRVQGRVFDSDTGQGIAGVSVRTMSARNMSWARSITDQDGLYELTGLAGEVKILNGGAPGYPRYGVYEWGALKTATVELGAEYSDVDFELAAGAPLSGRVIDANGAPVASALVFASQARMGGMRDDVFTDELGRFTLRNYQNTRDITLFAHKHDQASERLGPFAPGSPELDNLEIVLHDAATVEGVIVDGLGRPIQSASVIPRLHQDVDQGYGSIPGSPSSRSIEDGSFRLSPLPPGDLDLWLLPPGTNIYLSESFARFSVAAGEQKTDVRLVYDEGDGLDLSGIVTDFQGEPLSNMQVKISGPLHTMTRSGDDGRFRVARLPEGSYTVSAWGSGFSAFREADIPAGTTNIQIVLEANSRIVGTVVDADTAQPIGEFEVHVRSGSRPYYVWSSDYLFTEFSDGEGRFELDEAPAGEVTVTVRAPGYVTHFQQVEDTHPGGPAVELVIALSRGATIEGSVLDSEGAPAVGALLFIGPEPQVYRWHWDTIAAATTDPSGAFRINSLPADATLITAYLEGFAPTTRTLPERGDMRITLAMGSTIEGIVSVNGLPLADAYVHIMFPDRDDVTSHGYRTDAEGRFQASELADGTASLRADQKLGDGLFHRRSIFSPAEVEEDMLTSVVMDFPETTAILTGNIFYNDHAVPHLGVSLDIESSDGNTYHYQVPVGLDGSYTVYDIVPGTGQFQLLRQVGENAHSASPGFLSVDFADSPATEQDVILSGPEQAGAEEVNPWRASNVAFWRAWLAHIKDLAPQ